MKKIVFLIFGLLFVLTSVAQVDFKTDRHYLNGQSLWRVNIHDSGEMWCIGIDSTKVFQINADGTYVDQSQKIQDAIGDKITSVFCLEKGHVLLGTKSKSLWRLNSDVFKRLGTQDGLEALHITSLVSIKDDFHTGVKSIKVGTHTGYYLSSDGILFEKQNSRGIYTFYDYNFYKHAYDTRIEYISTTRSAMYGQRFYTLPDSISICNEIRLLREYPVTYGAVTDKGYYRGNNYGKKPVIPNISANTVINYEGRALVGTSEGLYLDNFTDIPRKIDLQADYNIQQIFSHEDCLWLATDMGLLRLTNINCAYFDVDFSASRLLVNLADSSEVKFDPTCNTCFDNLSWTFGDGGESNLNVPIYQFSKLGNHQVEFSANNESCSDSKSKELFVIDEALLNQVKFTKSDLDIGKGNTTSVNVLDFDNDDDLDLFFGHFSYSTNSTSTIPELYVNDGAGNFTLHSAFQKMAYRLTATSWADTDNDRKKEIIYASIDGLAIHHVEENKTDTIYKSSGLSVNTIVPSDLNNDGWIDLVLTQTESSNLIFMNNGKGGFTKKYDSAFSSGKLSYFTMCMDVDNDNDQDIMTLNNTWNHLYINDGNGNFSENVKHTICQWNTQTDEKEKVSMSWADFSNDGEIDVVTANQENIRVFENKSKLEFEAYKQFYGEPSPQWSTNTNWIDVENDGDKDLMILSERLQHFLYFNTEKHGFFKTRFLDYDQEGLYIQGSLPADLNGDGLCDIVLVANSSNDRILINNTPNKNHYLKIAFFPFESNYSAIGAKAYIYYAGTKMQMQEVLGASSIHAQKPGILNFGMGKYTAADSVVVHWPSKQITTLRNIQVDKLVKVIEKPKFDDIVVCRGDSYAIGMPENEGVVCTWYRNGEKINLNGKNSISIGSEGNYKLDVNQYETLISSNTFNVQLNEKPDVAIAEPLITDLCVGDEFVYSASGAGHYQWFFGNELMKNTDAASIRVSEAGSYFVVGTNNLGCKDTSLVHVVNHLNSPEFNLGNDTTLCGDQSLKLAPKVEGQFLWSDGSIEESITISKKGKYWLSVTNDLGCKTTDTINLLQGILTDFYLPADTSLCGNSEFILPEGDDVEYLLNGSSQWGNHIYIPYSGAFNIGLKTKACFIEKTINIRLNPAPYFSLGRDTSIYKTKSLTLRAPKGYKTYLWNDKSELDSLVVDANMFTPGYHDFSVRIKDQNDCETENSIGVLISLVTGIEGLEKGIIRIFPNPADQFLNIELPTGLNEDENSAYEIWDLNGRLILSQKFSDHIYQQINVSNLVPGLYLFKIKIADQMISTKILIQR